MTSMIKTDPFFDVIDFQDDQNYRTRQNVDEDDDYDIMDLDEDQEDGGAWEKNNAGRSSSSSSSSSRGKKGGGNFTVSSIYRPVEKCYNSGDIDFVLLVSIFDVQSDIPIHRTSSCTDLSISLGYIQPDEPI